MHGKSGKNDWKRKKVDEKVGPPGIHLFTNAGMQYFIGLQGNLGKEVDRLF